MQRSEAALIGRDLLLKHGLHDWGLRLNPDSRLEYLGLCSYKDKCIILNAHHVDTHPDASVINTLKHEIAHALTPGHQHDSVWREKAIEVGCTEFSACSAISFSPTAIDAIRSGATLEVEVDIETIPEQTIYKPKYKITQLRDKCEVCGKVAITKGEIDLPNDDPFKPDVKLIYLECGHIIKKLLPKGTPFQTIKSDDGKVPYKYQIEGMRFAEAGLALNSGVLISDEMGLGKTPQSIGVALFHEEYFPIVCVVKSGIKFQWFREWLRWSNDKYLAQVIQSSNDVVIPKLKLYIVSYDIFVQKTRVRNGKAIQQGFDYKKFDHCKTVILDECQQIKNVDSARTQEIRKLVKGKKIIGLSGTPWKNRASEYFSILNMIAPMKFNSYQKFIEDWCEQYYKGNQLKIGGIKRHRLEAFREWTKDIIIRRERSDAMPDLPTISRMMFFCEAEAKEQEIIDENTDDFVKWYHNNEIEGTENSQENQMELLSRLNTMRQLTGLAKVKHTLEWVDEFVEDTDRKLVIFVHHVAVGEALYKGLTDKYGSEMPVLRIVSSMGSQERMNTQEQFNTAPRALMVASTLAAGEGLNLQTCSDCIIHERQWNPANEEQAEGRFIRIGQTADKVNATYMLIQGAVDDHMTSLVEEKRTHFHATMNSGEAPIWQQGSLMKELAERIIKNHRRK